MTSPNARRSSGIGRARGCVEIADINSLMQTANPKLTDGLATSTRNVSVDFAEACRQEVD